MKQKINLRLATIALIAILATTLGITSVYYAIFQNRVRSDLETNARLLADTGFFQALYEGAEGEPESIDQGALTGLDAENLRVTWIAADGTVLYDNDTDAADLGNHLDRPEIVQAMEAGSGESMRRSDTQNMNSFYYAVRLDNGTVLRVSTQARSIFSVFISAVPVILVILAVILGLCILIGHYLAVQLLRPIDHMAENLDRMDAIEYRELEPFARKIRSQHDRILEAAKSRQDFTANISHELKTPLTAISGYAELIENRMVDDSQQAHIGLEIRRNADRLLSLINDSIRLSELDHQELPRKMEPLNFYKLAEDVCRALRISAEQHNVALTCIGSDTMLTGDRELLKELL